MRSLSRSLYVTAVIALAAQPLEAQVIWTDWLAAGPGTVSGSLAVPGSATVTYAGGYSYAQLSGGGDFWRNGGTAWAAYDAVNAPTGTDFIQLIGATTNTITFSQAMLNPYMAIISQGQPGLPVNYSFLGGTRFKVIDEGRGTFGDGFYERDGDGQARNGSYAGLSSVLSGYEFHGIIQLEGTFTSFSWANNPDENWHGFTVGVDGIADPGVVPEPATVSLLALGLAGVGVLARRKRSA